MGHHHRCGAMETGNYQLAPLGFGWSEWLLSRHRLFPPPPRPNSWEWHLEEIRLELRGQSAHLCWQKSRLDARSAVSEMPSLNSWWYHAVCWVRSDLWPVSDLICCHQRCLEQGRCFYGCHKGILQVWYYVGLCSSKICRQESPSCV